MTSNLIDTFVLDIVVLRSSARMNRSFTMKQNEGVTVQVITRPDCYPLHDESGNAPVRIDSSESHITWQVSRTGERLYKPGENILFHLLEKKGQGLLLLHVIGLVNIQNVWHVEHTVTEIQLYAKKHGNFFTAAFKNNTNVQDQLKWMVRGDTNVPPFSTYVEIPPKMNTFIWVNRFNLTAALMTEKGQAFVHLKDVKKGNETCFQPGVEVSFELVPSEGAFAWKAINVAYPPSL